MAWQYLPLEPGERVRAEHVNELIDACSERGMSPLPAKAAHGQQTIGSTLFQIQETINQRAPMFWHVDDATQECWHYGPQDRSGGIYYPPIRNMYREILGLEGVTDWPYRVAVGGRLRAAALNHCHQVLNALTFKGINNGGATGNDDLGARAKWPVQVEGATVGETLQTMDAAAWQYGSLSSTWCRSHIVVDQPPECMWGGLEQYVSRIYYNLPATTFGPLYFLVRAHRYTKSLQG